MKITKNIKNKIKEIYKESNYNVKSVSLGYKNKHGKNTGEVCIVVRVREKKPLYALSSEEKIPETITVDDQEIKTDVIEDKEEIKALSCFSNISSDPQEYFSDDPNVVKLQGNPSLITPVRGGQEIFQFPTGFTSTTAVVGTLGFLCVDEIDNKVVGVTNNHVALDKGIINNDRNISEEISEPYNIIDPIEWTVDNNFYPPGALYRDQSPAGNDFNWVRSANNIKRYIPFDLDGPNYVDVAILIMDPEHIDQTSYQIHQPNGEPDYTPHLPFATESEIDSLLATPRTIYSTGRTTGPKGWGSDPSCLLTITNIDEFGVEVGELADDPLEFDDVIRFRYSDDSDFPIAGGDSGSAVIADFDGVRKIIGLAFAGSINEGIICRIDRIAEQIKIKEWDGNYTPDFTTPKAEKAIAPVEQNISANEITSPRCRPLYQSGTTLSDFRVKLDSVSAWDCTSTIPENNYLIASLRYDSKVVYFVEGGYGARSIETEPFTKEPFALDSRAYSYLNTNTDSFQPTGVYNFCAWSGDGTKFMLIDSSPPFATLFDTDTFTKSAIQPDITGFKNKYKNRTGALNEDASLLVITGNGELDGTPQEGGLLKIYRLNGSEYQLEATIEDDPDLNIRNDLPILFSNNDNQIILPQLKNNVSVNNTGKIFRVYDLTTGSFLSLPDATAPVGPLSEEFVNYTLSRDTTRLFALGEKGSMLVYDTSTWSLLNTFVVDNWRLSAIEYSLNMSVDDQTIYITDLNTFEKVSRSVVENQTSGDFEIIVQGSPEIFGLGHLTPDGVYMITADPKGNNISVYNLKTNSIEKYFDRDTISITAYGSTYVGVPKPSPMLPQSINIEPEVPDLSNVKITGGRAFGTSSHNISGGVIYTYKNFGFTEV